MFRPFGLRPDPRKTNKPTALHENYVSDPQRFNAIRGTILSIPTGNSQRNMPPPSTSSAQPQAHSSRNGYYNTSYTSYNTGSSAAPQPSHGYSNGGGVGSSSGYLGATRQPQADNMFKNTPFYTIETRIGPLHTCPVMSSHRNSINVTIKASEFPELARCANNSSSKVMVFCGSESTGPQDIQFPHQSEIKVNSNDIKHNLRGLKNKPGSTHPVDITPHLRLKQLNYINNVEFTYALTSKKFYLAVYVCKTHSIDELVTRIKGKKISKASVIRDISKKAADPDVIATSQVLSLLCPLSYTRLKVPCRGLSCNHIQCFDGSSFMQLQEQGPTWSCPICYKPAPFETLAIDEYVLEVLENTPESLQQVTIEPNGVWRTKTEDPEHMRSQNGADTKSEDDDDLSILSDSHGFGNGTPGGPLGGRINMSTPNRSLLSATPNGAARETPNPPRSGGNKRTAEVIDLTLSSDEDDEPIRPPKRQNLGPTMNAMSYPPAYNNNPY
ncbi:hypothetical protein M426DRAFT_20659 [Hypoxylon sp. CI-4A]|nr:hypothetical protein M426DRAFT_20659 [Hypoxylon sp. CI-4A]